MALQLLLGFVNGREINGLILPADLDPFIELDLVAGDALLRAVVAGGGSKPM